MMTGRIFNFMALLSAKKDAGRSVKDYKNILEVEPL